MNDVMLDLETLGKGANKCVCQIGAVYFDNITGELGKELKFTIDARTHEAYGGIVDADTVYWWLAQSDAARQSILQPGVDAKEAFIGLNEFLAPAKRIWSHSTFDFVTIMQSMKQMDIRPAFSYKNGLDIRTLVYLAGIKTAPVKRDGVHHDALDDAKHQVKYTVAALNAVKTSKVLINFANRLED